MNHDELVELIRGEIKHNISPVIGWLRMDAKVGRVDDDKDRLNHYRSQVEKAAEDIATKIERSMGMTPTEYAQNLIARGYTEIQEYKGRDYTLKPGDRVRKAAQRFGYETGTGAVERVFIKPDSAWSQTYGTDDVELIVHNDDGTYSYVAQYHVSKVGA